MTRLARKVAEVMEAYRALPADQRASFEQGLVAAAQALRSATAMTPEIQDGVKDAFGMALAEGYIAGNWWKVHEALADHAPELYVYLGPMLPNVPR